MINIFDYRVKKYAGYLGWFIAIALIFRTCNNKDTVQFTVKEITKTLPADTIVKHSIIKKETILKENNNDKLTSDIKDMYDRLEVYQDEIDYLNDYYKFSDSIQKDSLYKLTIQLKSFESEFEDENLKLKINGFLLNNTIKELTPTYTIKQKTHEIPIKSYNRILLGAEVGINNDLNNYTYKANLMYQNKKGNTTGASFQKINNQNYFLIGKTISVIKF